MTRKTLITFSFSVVAALSFMSTGLWYHGNDNQQTKRSDIEEKELTTTSNRHLSVVDPSNRKPPSDIQYAAFGTSITWGLGLQNRETGSYVKRLSPQGANFGIRGSGPNYPSACTYSMIGDRHFDVIILEFFSIYQGFDVLVGRLRERFPDAIIIILREWHPLHITTESGIETKQWAEEKFGDHAFRHPKLHSAFKESKEKWIWNSPVERYRITFHEMLEQKYDAIILPMEKPDDPRRWVDYAHYFTPDFLHKSDSGHEEIAQRIRTVVNRLGVPMEPRRGEWTSVDWCHNWFHSGDVSFVGRRHNMRNMPLRPFADGSKYALELHAKESRMRVKNPSGEDMRLYIEYMVKSPCCHYPRVQVTMEGKKKSAILKQIAPSYFGTRPVHVTVMQYIGMIPPGQSFLRFSQLEEKEWPFRLVSVAVTHEELVFTPGRPLEDERI